MIQKICILGAPCLKLQVAPPENFFLPSSVCCFHNLGRGLVNLILFISFLSLEILNSFLSLLNLYPLSNRQCFNLEEVATQ